MTRGSPASTIMSHVQPLLCPRTTPQPSPLPAPPAQATSSDCKCKRCPINSTLEVVLEIEHYPGTHRLDDRSTLPSLRG
eukprot:CAMPEP_0115513502 /NCGR_PEP_ID=MMETSP0271-20121206/75116_1 /TAXON_ID=71861 /ORGANISM="Scrippsiella trochoidea, Strain CCMP3099" /LENGTH=78 /DNA_ID=CAMNT_0002943809 /DNA_START=128 /DNA_END=361 /DNA_ORIENTATION=-